MKIALFDLDGTLRQSKSGKTFINEPFDQKPILENLNKALILKSQGWQIVGITNQGGVEAGHKSIHSAMMEQLYSAHMLKLDLLLFCPDKGSICWEIDPYLPKNGIFKHECSMAPIFRKPESGMLLRALETVTRGEFGFMTGHKVNQKGVSFSGMHYQQVDNSKVTTFYCGDRPEDAEAASKIGIRFIHARDFANDKTTKAKLG